jgi:hypothetical protein
VDFDAVVHYYNHIRPHTSECAKTASIRPARSASATKAASTKSALAEPTRAVP